MYLINVQTKDDPKNGSNCIAMSIVNMLGIVENIVKVHGSDIIKITIKQSL